MSKTALVLAGGGSRGSYELGVWQALREMDIDIHIVTGTSIGAINGAMIAQGDYDIAVRLWDSIETSHVVNLPINEENALRQKVQQTYQSFVFNFIKSGGTDVNPLKETLYTFLNEEKVRSSKVNYGLVTIEMDAKIPHELFISDIPQGKMVDYILASASIYPAFKPHVINNVRYVDGAYYDNLPIKMAVEKGATDIIAVNLEAFGVIKKESFQLAHHVTYIRSYWNLGPSLVFDHATMQHNIRLGYLDTLKAYGAYEGYAFTFISGFCKKIMTQFTDCLPLETLLKKSGGGVLDQLFLGSIKKIFGERGVPNPTDAEIALVCAELAGEIFGLGSETIYSYEIWQNQLYQRVAKTTLPSDIKGNAKKGHDLFKTLQDKAVILLSKESRVKQMGTMIAKLLESQTYRRSITSLTVLPEIFLAGIYLAATKLL